MSDETDRTDTLDELARKLGIDQSERTDPPGSNHWMYGWDRYCETMTRIAHEFDEGVETHIASELRRRGPIAGYTRDMGALAVHLWHLGFRGVRTMRHFRPAGHLGRPKPMFGGRR